GIEPVRYRYRRILSPVRLPVPPLQRIFLCRHLTTKLIIYDEHNTVNIFFAFFYIFLYFFINPSKIAISSGLISEISLLILWLKSIKSKK
ncbi:hypothetical protein, partial [Clostridium sp. D43t1_170807_H7]|uniref:hypothetical protein n=1 Tax=Clostridium sp. D43t1_170807_H7 TaxID=2787140 RepID=UPI001A9B3E51